MMDFQVKSFFSCVTFLQQYRLTDGLGQKIRVEQGYED